MLKYFILAFYSFHFNFYDIYIFLIFLYYRIEDFQWFQLSMFFIYTENKCQDVVISHGMRIPLYIYNTMWKEIQCSKVWP